MPVLRAVDAGARAAGLRPGMRLADAYGLCPALVSAEADLQVEREGLEALARWCQRWSPIVVADAAIEAREEGGGASLLLDMAGCLHLFGGARALLWQVQDVLARRGLTTRVALAADPLAAWAWARFGAGDRRILKTADPRLQHLPLAALRLQPRTGRALHRLGFHRLAQVMAMPRAALARRYGADIVHRLDQLEGRRPWPLRPVAETFALAEARNFAQPIGRTEDIEAVALGLLELLCQRLEHAEQGALRLVLVLTRPHGQAKRLEIGLGRPTRELAHLRRLLRLRLEDLLLRSEEGIERLELQIMEMMPLKPAQTGGTGESVDRSADLARLADQLELRLGADRVVRLEPVASHVPERAVRQRRLAEPATATAWPPLSPRPLRLLAARPRPEALGLRPEEVGILEGPERILPEWWRPEDATAPPRDYVVAILRDGRRFWLCREDASQSLAWGGWVVHGRFD
ncbi:protein ImuB [Arboricoccus pini]|uniref:DNA-directed DNA polymerase n=2 Tax=Arboricoccus pini TaxID=1963835 RepID=A0A212QQ90_9PROT|nr:protein ImuB [Arboricoccus pini]